MKKYFRALLHVSVFLFLLTAVLSAINFPYNTDAPLTAQEIEAAKKYYAQAYGEPVETPGNSAYETAYIEAAEAAAKEFNIESEVRAFVDRFNLKTEPVLEIGSGRGYLQDVADNYTGLDISPSVARFYHKKFVQGSATALPFADNAFAGIWTIWVLEHVQNPEQAFSEIRRVLRDKGVIYLGVAWNVPSWRSQGYNIRPYSDFGMWGKIVKASIPLRESGFYKLLSVPPIRLVRKIAAKMGPTRLRYHRLTPNYNEYWEQDSDAVNSIDVHEAVNWFTSRGDECLNCEDRTIFRDGAAPIIRVKKS